MTAKTQIIVLLFSCFYGLIFTFLYYLHNHIIKKKKRVFRSLATILFMYNIVLIYLILLFKLNNGQFHIYFFLMIIIGYLIGNKLLKILLSNVKYREFIAKRKKKCYTKTK